MRSVISEKKKNYWQYLDQTNCPALTYKLVSGFLSKGVLEHIGVGIGSLGVGQSVNELDKVLPLQT